MEEESIVTTIVGRDDRSDFDKAFEDDTLHQLQERMIAKAKTKRFTAEDFIAKAKADLEGEVELVEEVAEGVETPEPEEEIVYNFF